MQRRRIMQLVVLALALFGVVTDVEAQRVKDLGRVEGIREVDLKGPGLVIGLAGTGDNQRSPLTREFYASILENLGINGEINDESIKSKNVALVMVTARVPSTTKPGSRIEVTVSSIGDAKSLEGGILLETTLGFPGRAIKGSKEHPVVAVAQGRVEVQGKTATVGRGTGTLEYDITIPFLRPDRESFRVLLHNPDFSTADRLARAINEFPYLRFNAPDSLPVARALDSGSVDVNIPAKFRGDDQVVNFISRVMGEVHVPQVDQDARVVIDSATGMITVNGKVRVSEVVVMINDIEISIEGRGAGEQLPFLTDVIGLLRQEGITNRELPSIVRSIKSAGALVGELVER